VKYLLSIGTDVHRDKDDALYQACINEQIEIIKMLLDAGADPNAQNGEFLKYIKYDNPEILRILKKASQQTKNQRKRK
jgi:ankyrin repeat protein